MAIEGNTLDEHQITAILEGKPVIAPPREIQEVRNAAMAYESLESWTPTTLQDLLHSHRVMMSELAPDAGSFRKGGVGVYRGDQLVHMAPPADRVEHLVKDLFAWLASTDTHPLISSAVVHYEWVASGRP